MVSLHAAGSNPIKTDWAFHLGDSFSAQIGAREYRSVPQRQQGRKIGPFDAKMFVVRGGFELQCRAKHRWLSALPLAFAVT